MRNEHLFPGEREYLDRLSARATAQAIEPITRFPRQTVVVVLLVIALLAFEVFNFDTTRFALLSLLGDVGFAGLRWASILALAFCAIDFAGLAHLFSPAENDEPGGETVYLMAAWLLGATMNALMTWWAVNLTLLNHELGNEVLSREQLLNVVPTFVAVLVWLTRILFIGAFSIAGNHLVQGLNGVEAEPDGRPLSFHPAERRAYELSVAGESPRRPLRDRAFLDAPHSGAVKRPIPRSARPAPAGVSARGRHRD